MTIKDMKQAVRLLDEEWKKMRDKRENYEISDEEYLEWKLNYNNNL